MKSMIPYNSFISLNIRPEWTGSAVKRTLAWANGSY